MQSLFETITLAGNPVTLLGLTGLACVAAWPFLRDRRSALAVQSAGALAFAMHFALLGAFTAAAASGLSLVQLLVAITSSDPHRRRSLDGLMLVALMLLLVAGCCCPPSQQYEPCRDVGRAYKGIYIRPPTFQDPPRPTELPPLNGVR